MRQPDLNAHLTVLRKEFAGQSELLFYHAMLIALLRRRIEVAENLPRLRALWASEQAFLLEALDSRWLVSACDTIVDHWPEPDERALALATSLFANTIKLYETERIATGGVQGEYTLPEGRVALHDGMTAFQIGEGDMIFNLVRRIEATTAQAGTAAQILRELVKRASKHDTVFRRFRAVHNRDATAW
jgi:hypothetical protein